MVRQVLLSGKELDMMMIINKITNSQGYMYIDGKRFLLPSVDAATSSMKSPCGLT